MNWGHCWPSVPAPDEAEWGKSVECLAGENLPQCRFVDHRTRPGLGSWRLTARATAQPLSDEHTSCFSGRKNKPNKTLSRIIFQAEWTACMKPWSDAGQEGAQKGTVEAHLLPACGSEQTVGDEVMEGGVLLLGERSCVFSRRGSPLHPACSPPCLPPVLLSTTHDVSPSA
jgi:hypothetical protein